ncbi:peptide deformylase [Pelagibacteraceae bacterium]|jgi:peptide deformylase|nr:peptide deformylase [Pelagibacteraceae bacterium]
MTIRKILTEPDPFLRQKSHNVDSVDNEIRKLMDDMLDTMYSAPGIGLAAIQVGIPKRIIVIDLSKEDEKKPLYFVNPKIILKSNINATYEEGCLSVPGQFAEIDRPDKCIINYLDYNNKQQELKAEGLLATCIQHEIDHLEGVLFIDYLSKLKKNFITKKLSKQKKSLERIVV